VSINEILTYLGVFVGGVMLTLAGYGKKPKPPEQESVVAGIGMELGNRMQTDQIIHELKRIADSLAAISDRREAARDEMMREMLERLEDKERRN
jgi:hypothetical protein